MAMQLKLCSFNCRGFSVSKVKHLTELLLHCDILMLQETWLYESQIGRINQYFPNFNTLGISGMNENVIIYGRRYGGCSFLINKSLSAITTYIELNSKRVCCIRIKAQFGFLYVFNVYMPCDTYSNEYLQEYNDVLSTISKCLYQHKIEYCLIFGDMNTDLSRHRSGNTISLTSSVQNENLSLY